MTAKGRTSFLFFGASGCLSGALLLAGQPILALACGATAFVWGGWQNLRRRPTDWRGAGRASPWSAGALAFPAGIRGWRRKRAKFLLRSAWHAEATRRWLRRLERTDAHPLWLVRPRLATKLQRPYMRSDWAVDRRLAALISHYDLLRDFFSSPARERLYGEGLPLVRIGVAAGQGVELRLVYRDQFEKEGELSLVIEDLATGLLLAGLTFCVAEDDGERIAWVGGLQASPDPRARDLIHAATKALHGMRPKAFALWALRQLCAPWQVAAIRAVGDERHVYRHWRKRRAIHARYDEFWSESGGVRRDDADWDLPLRVAERPRSELKPSRRKAHELRYAMLAELRAELLAANAVLAPEADPEEATALPRAFGAAVLTSSGTP